VSSLDKTLTHSKTFAESLQDGVKQGLFSFYTLFKVMTPVYIFISILKKLEILDWLAVYFSPLMKYFGLPGEAALAVLTGWVVNLYGAIAVLAGLNLSVRQVTILAVMLGISHSLFIETAIIRRMNARPWIILIGRITVSLIVGFILNLILPDVL